MRNYSSPYIDMYQSHTAGYPNGGFYPDMTSGIPPFPGRDLECRPPPSDSGEGGNINNWLIYYTLTKLIMCLLLTRVSMFHIHHQEERLQLT